MGTDDLGRDIVARSLVATRLTLLMSLAATGIAVIAGVAIGSSIWLAPHAVREWVLRLIDSTVAFPSLILALVVAAILGPATTSAILAIGIAGIPSFARIASNMTATIAQRDFVTQAHLLGVPPLRLLTRHLLPNISGPLLVMIASSFALSLLEISSLSFVGLGVQSPDYDWGKLLNEGLPAIYSSPLQVVAPSAMLIFAGVAAMLTGDGLAQYLDPWGKQPRAVKAKKSAVMTSTAPDALVEVRGLVVTAAGGTTLVKGIDFEIAPGEILGLVGESGSGKSMTAMSLAGLTPESVAVEAGVLRVGDMDLRTGGSGSRLAKEIGLVYQDPGSTFNPALRMEGQLTEVARVHLGMGRKEANSTLVDALRTMRIREPEKRMKQHPFQLSGGMLQRAIVASSLVTDPRLIIADEPTTALDVTVQAGVLGQLKQVNRERGTAILFISHDLGVVKALCDRVLVMRDGEIVEQLTAAELDADKAQHPYTRALLSATPTLEVPTAEAGTTLESAEPARPTAVANPLLVISGLNVILGHGMSANHVLRDVDIAVGRGTTVALVGESGSGKSTIARTIVGIHKPVSGSIHFDGEASTAARTQMRRRIQLIPQDPYSSLDPRRTVGQTLAEAVDPIRPRVNGDRAKIVAALVAVALDESVIDRYPHEFSGGQRQRIAIARALVVEPELIIADEITSALDVSTQAEILALLDKLRREFQLTMLFITHNLAVVRQVCDEVVVLLHGDVVEAGRVEEVFRSPRSDYTRTLLQSVPGGPQFNLEGAT